MAPTLTESVSNWIVNDSNPEDEEQNDDVIFTASPSQKKNKTKHPQDLFPVNTQQPEWDKLGKRRGRDFPFKLEQNTLAKPVVVNPRKIFRADSLEHFDIVVSKIQEQLDLEDYFSEENGLSNFSQVPSTPNEPEIDIESLIPQLTATPTYSDLNDEDLPFFDNCEVTSTIEFSKRGNGNQPWKLSCVSPTKIGKMRKINVKIQTPSYFAIPLEIRVRTVDQQPGEHKGKLVLCSDDRCCVKTKVDGKKPTIQCEERKSTLIKNISISQENPTAVDFYLKPVWNGLGPSKLRPQFDVHVELVNPKNGKIYPLLSWFTEIQSHKFESSSKAKQLENDSDTSEHTSTITL